MEGWAELKPWEHVVAPSVSYGAPKSYALENYRDAQGMTSFALQYTADFFTMAPLTMYLPEEVKLQPVAPNRAVFLGGVDGKKPLSPIFDLPVTGWVTGVYSPSPAGIDGSWGLNVESYPNFSWLSKAQTPAGRTDTVSFYNLPSAMKTNYLVFAPGVRTAMDYAQASYVNKDLFGQQRFNDGRSASTVSSARTSAFGTGLHYLNGEYAHQGEVNAALAHQHGIPLHHFSGYSSYSSY